MRLPVWRHHHWWIERFQRFGCYSCEECLVEVGEGAHAGLLGPLGEVVVEQPRRRDVPGVLEDLAAVVAAGRRRGWPRRCSALTSSASLGC
jgi:hypothetical protein